MCIWCVSPRSRLASSSVLRFEAVDSALRLRLPPALRPREHHSLLLGCWDELSACRVCVADSGACGPTHILGCLIGSIVWHRNSCWTEPITDGNVPSVFVSSASMEARKLPGIYIVFNHCIAFHCVRASLVAQVVKHVPVVQETWVQSLGQEDPLEKGMATHSLGNGYSCLGNPMDGGAWWATVHAVTKSWIWLSNSFFLKNSCLFIWLCQVFIGACGCCFVVLGTLVVAHVLWSRCAQ